MTAVGIYTRISRDRIGAGLGVDRQEKDCRELAARHGWTIARVYRDNDLSAYSGKPRPGYRQMLNDITAGTINVVAAWHTDRLHRSPAELEEYISACDPRGIPTHTVKAGPLDLATPSGRLVARQLGAVARFEVEHAIERGQAAKAQAAAAGRWKGGRRPYGYEADGITVRESEAAIVQHMAEQIIAGASLRGLAADLNGRGETTSTGRPWRADVISSVITRPRNAGLMEHRGQVLEGVAAQWPAILDPDLWRAARFVLGDPARRTTPGPARRWLLSGIATCGVCSASCFATRVGGHPGKTLPTSYACREARHVVRIASEVDSYVRDLVVARLSRPDAIALLAPTTYADTTALHGEVAVLRERLDELGRAFADGDIDARQLREGSERLRSRIEAATTAIASAARGSVLDGVVGEEDVAATWDGLHLDRRRAIIRALCEVTILRARRGRRPGWRSEESYFDPETVDFQWVDSRLAG
jgi:site-specific DNA recombinase